MATVKALIRPNEMRADKTWNVKIRITHERKQKYISTSMYVSKRDITSSFKIKNAQILQKCDELVCEYREKINALNLELVQLSIEQVVARLTQKQEAGDRIDFIAFSLGWLEAHQEIKGGKNYRSALNSFCDFMGRKVVFADEVTVKLLVAFERHLMAKPRAQSLYTSSIVRLFNEAKMQFNDEDGGVIRIANSLDKYKPKRQNVAEKRALTIEEVRRIFAAPYKGDGGRRDLAKDCFMLSFCLMGINSADLYNATDYDGEYLSFNRTKTKDRKRDKALLRVKIHPKIKEVFDRWRDGKQRVFSFYRRYADYSVLNQAINKGLKELGAEIGIERLQYYAARHSFATIAVNDAKINVYLVNEMLTHSDASLSMTQLYIKKDFERLNEANFEFLNFFFGYTSK